MPNIAHKAYDHISYPDEKEVLSLKKEQNLTKEPVMLLHLACAILMSSYNLAFNHDALLPSYVSLRTQIGSHGYLYETENAMILSYRGTVTSEDVISDINAVQTTMIDSRGNSHEGMLVHKGFQQVWETSIADHRRLENKLLGRPATSSRYELSLSARKKTLPRTPKLVMIVGHSLGGSSAFMSALSLSLAGYRGPVVLITFGTPRVGNEKFVSALEKLPNTRILCVSNKNDVIPALPPPAFSFGGDTWMYSSFTSNVGIDVQTGSMKKNHSMSTYAYGLTGKNLDGEFVDPVWHRPPTYSSITAGAHHDSLLKNIFSPE